MELSKNKNVFVEDIKKESTMKVITYEEWLRNPTPRMMWVWDVNEKDKVRRKVVYVVKGEPCNYPVITVVSDETAEARYRHCAEIEKQRRMTNKELARWLREKPTREYKRSSRTDIVVYCFYSYIEEDADQEVDENFLIREGDSDWREPLVEE